MYLKYSRKYSPKMYLKYKYKILCCILNRILNTCILNTANHWLSRIAAKSFVVTGAAHGHFTCLGIQCCQSDMGLNVLYKKVSGRIMSPESR